MGRKIETGSSPKGRKTKSSTDANVAQQALRHNRIRKDHKAEIAEDYVETISQLIRTHGEARTVDLARRLGVSHVTVTKTISRLQHDGLVRSEPYRSIFLTNDGEVLAKKSEDRHRLIVAFLRKIGVSATDAETDAEGIEHHVSEATISAIRRFVDAES